MRAAAIAFACLVVAAPVVPGMAKPVPTVRAEAGGLDGSWYWVLPDTPNGLRPLQNWLSTGSASNGDIYITASDHATNSALYRMRTGTDVFAYVGDAKEASLAAGNWAPDETAEKFHVRPTWHGGQLYLPTLDYSLQDDGYLNERGFHWYGYNWRDGLVDLSTSEPGGVGVPHLGIVSIASDPKNNVIYGAALPTGEIVRYDVAARQTTVLGRPATLNRDYPYLGRFMWTDSRGRLYFTAGFSRVYSAIYASVYRYTPGSGFEQLTDWPLLDSHAIDTGQCFAGDGGKICYVADSLGRMYRFTNRGPTWTFLGEIGDGSIGPIDVTSATRIWAFHVNADETKAYAVTTPDGALIEYDFATRQSRVLCTVADLYPGFFPANNNTGYDAWDNEGRFFFVSSISQKDPAFGSRNAVVWRIDPVRLKAALGLAP